MHKCVPLGMAFIIASSVLMTYSQVIQISHLDKTLVAQIQHKSNQADDFVSRARTLKFLLNVGQCHSFHSPGL